MKTETTYLYCSVCGVKITDYITKHWILKHPNKVKWETIGLDDE